MGEARPRPAVADATPAEWRAYLHLRRNVAGWSVESWYHRAGCRRYFRAERHTVTNEFRAPRPAGAADVPRPRTGTAVPEETA